MNEPSDEARDPHLREALRHAPDADLQAPPQLSELILKEARAKARDPKPANLPTPSWARRAWDWLARPAVATGFAGVMAATLVGLMWWDEPMDEALPRSPVPAAAPMTAPVAGKPATQEAPATEPSPPAPPGAAPPNAKPEPARKKSEASRSAPPAARDTPADTAGMSAEVTRPASPPAPALRAAAPVPAPAAAPPAVSADASTDALLAQARAREEEQKRERSSMAPAEAQSRRAAAKAQLNESRLQREGEAYTRIASVRAAIAREPARWTWQGGSTGPKPIDDAIADWLVQFDAVTGTRWQAHQAGAALAQQSRTLTLLRDGNVQHHFQFTNRGILWLRGDTAWHVELSDEALAKLQAALDAASR
jgi:hypothetical protein